MAPARRSESLLPQRGRSAVCHDPSTIAKGGARFPHVPAAKGIEYCVDSSAGQTQNLLVEILTAIVDRGTPEVDDRLCAPGRTRAIQGQTAKPAQLQERSANAPRCTMDQDALARMGVSAVVEHLVCGDVVQEEADRLGRVQIVGDADQLLALHTDVLGVGTADGHRPDELADSEPFDPVSQGVDAADKVPAGGVRHTRGFRMDSFARHDIGHGDAGGQDLHAYLTRLRFRSVLLDQLQLLWATVSSDHNALMSHGCLRWGSVARLCSA